MPVDNLIPNMQFTPIYQRYIGNALQEEKALMDRVETKAASVDAYYDQIDAATKAAQAAPFSNDQAYLVKAKQEAAAALKMAHERGDYENLGKHAKLAASEFQKYYVPIAQNHKALQEAVTKEMDADNGYDPIRKSAWLKRQKRLYEENGGLQIDPVTGQANNFFSGQTLNKYVDYGEKALKMANDVKDTDINYTNGKPTSLKLPNGEVIEGKYLVDSFSTKGVNAGTIKQVIQNYLHTNPQYQYQATVEAQIDAELAGNKGITNTLSKLDKKDLNLFVNNLQKQGKNINNITPEDLYIEYYKDAKEKGLILSGQFSGTHQLTEHHINALTDDVRVHALNAAADKIEANKSTILGVTGSNNVLFDIQDKLQQKGDYSNLLNQANKDKQSAKSNISKLLSGFGYPSPVVLPDLVQNDFQNLRNLGKEITLENLQKFSKNSQLWKSPKMTEETFNILTNENDNIKKSENVANSATANLNNISNSEKEFKNSIDYAQLLKKQDTLLKSIFGGSGNTYNKDKSLETLKKLNLLDDKGIIKLENFSYDNYKKAVLAFTPEALNLLSRKGNPEILLQKAYSDVINSIEDNGILKPNTNVTKEFLNVDKKSTIGMFNEQELANFQNNWQTYTNNRHVLAEDLQTRGAYDATGKRVAIKEEDIPTLKVQSVAPSTLAGKLSMTFTLGSDPKPYKTYVDANTANSLGQFKTDALKDIVKGLKGELQGDNQREVRNNAAQTLAEEAIPDLQWFNKDNKQEVTYISPLSDYKYTVKPSPNGGSSWTIWLNNGVNNKMIGSITNKDDLAKAIGTIEATK